MPTIGENIKSARIKKGFTQQQLATALNTTKSAVSRYELGKREPKYRLLQEMATILDTSCSVLIGDADTELEMRRSALKSDIQAALKDFDDADKKMEKEMLANYRQLNFDGKQELYNYAASLAALPQYRD